jgi:mannitol/fructose-specific phosphotransferase system IIA component
MDALRKEVKDAGGEVLICTGERLRKAAGESRLKEKARDRVAEAMQGSGLIAIPSVPEDQSREVYVTSLTSDLALLFLALHNASEDNLANRVLPAVGLAGSAYEKADALDELAETLDDARELAKKITGTGGA